MSPFVSFSHCCCAARDKAYKVTYLVIAVIYGDLPENTGIYVDPRDPEAQEEDNITSVVVMLESDAGCCCWLVE